ncbi:MAG: hypothetical protein NTX88_10100, partial [Candidatus Atribacteria bacterium]|nr:hypothetical protein [Candidatus Atribacteria bacterium]
MAPFSLAQNATDVNLRNGTPTGLSVYMDGSFAVKIEPGDRATLTGIEVGRTYIITLRDGNNVSFFKNLTLTTNVCLPLKIPEDFQLFLPLSLEILSVSGGDAGQELLIEGRIHGGDEGVKELWADINGRMIIIPTNPDMTFQAVIGKEEISDATALSLSAKDGISFFEIFLIIVLVLLATTDGCRAEPYSIWVYFDETGSFGSGPVIFFLNGEPKPLINRSKVSDVTYTITLPVGSVLLELAVLQEGNTWHVVSETNFQLTKPRTELHFPSDFNNPQTQKNYPVSTPIPPPLENGEAGGWVVWLSILLVCGLASAIAFFMVSQSRKRRRVPLPPPPPQEDITKAWSQTRIVFRRDDFHHLPFSEYRTEHLASGGQAQIYKAWHPMMRKFVAIKQLDPKRVSDPFIRDHFHRGAQITFNLTHPNIVHLFEDCIEGNLHFLVMELLGTSLEGMMREKGLLPVPVVLTILDQIGRA